MSNGRELLDAVDRQRPDLILLDISMPLLNGIEAAWQTRKKAPEVKIVVLTQQTAIEYVQAAFEAGARGYFTLQISVKTVEFHKARLMDQLGLHTTAELTRYAIEHGII